MARWSIYLVIIIKENKQTYVVPYESDKKIRKKEKARVRAQLSMPSLRFSPRDEELLVDFLRPHVVSGDPLPSDVVRALDVYSKDPWELVGDQEQEAYFITRRSRTSGGSSRVQRTTPSGTWKMENKVEVRDESGAAIVGTRALLSFHLAANKRKATGWVMHEFLLIDGKEKRVSSSSSFSFQEVALCRIRRTHRRESPLLLLDNKKRIKKMIYNNLGDQEEEEEDPSVPSVTDVIIDGHHQDSPFLDYESSMMVISPQSVLENPSASSLMAVQSPQQQEEDDGNGGLLVLDLDVGNNACTEGDVTGVPQQQQVVIDCNDATDDQWEMFCNSVAPDGGGVAPVLPSNTPTLLQQSCTSLVGSNTPVLEGEMGSSVICDADDHATTPEPTIGGILATMAMPNGTSSLTGDGEAAYINGRSFITGKGEAACNNGSSELIVDPEFSIWEQLIVGMTPSLATAADQFSGSIWDFDQFSSSIWDFDY